ncbi:hypothetical protein ROHU_000601 [Labeo rohita]|uniref:Uncharacterized protein n=1 Tax=Labeo rohita TaxID=84645 RepID=A0A498P2Y1_LABRO|nr:hypothetical protein ROHU_000601 [Labeo rohita]
METTPHHRDGGAMEKIHEEVTLEAKEYSGGITGKYTTFKPSTSSLKNTELRGIPRRRVSSGDISGLNRSMLL